MPTNDQYLQMLQAALPRGAAWPRRPDATLTRLLAAFADGLARIDARALQLLEEADTRSTRELLDRWERLYGLPDPCAGPQPTFEQRRTQVYYRRTNTGAKSAPDFIARAAALGYPSVTITQYTPTRFGAARFGQKLRGPEWSTVWDMNLPKNSTSIARFGTARCGEPLGKLGDQVLRCEISAIAPAHTFLRFIYPP